MEIDRFYLVVELGLYFVVAWVGSRFPDFAEPAEHPRHRGIIHSLGFFVLIVILSLVFLIALNYPPPPTLFAPFTLLPPTLANLLSIVPHVMLPFLAGYGSHLFLDKLSQ